MLHYCATITVTNNTSHQAVPHQAYQQRMLQFNDSYLFTQIFLHNALFFFHILDLALSMR